MKSIRIIALMGICAVGLGGVFLQGATIVHADTAAIVPTAAAATSDTSSAVAVASDNCGITAADIGKIAAVQADPTLSATDEVKQELAVRKQLITETIACALTDVQSLQSALNNVSANGGGTDSIKGQLESRLNDATNFYSLEITKLNGAGIAGSEDIAREILAWRQGTYAPLAGQVGNFILWAENQSLFATAQTRMDQTQQAVSFIESASSNANLQSTFNAAYSSFQTAKNDNAAAQAALAQSLSPDQSLTLIKQSLDALSATYQQFFDVSNIIKTLLPQ